MSKAWRSRPPVEQAAIIAEVRRLKASNNWPGWNETAKRFGLSVTGLRENCEPAFRDRRRAIDKIWRARIAYRRRKSGAEYFREKYGEPANHVVTGPPKEHIAARLAEIPEDTRTEAQRLMGDPIPGDARRMRPA